MYCILCVCVCVCTCLRACVSFTPSSADEHLGLDCFHILAVVNSAALNISNQCLFFPFWYIPRDGIAESYTNSIFSFLRNFHTVFHSDCTTSHLHQHYRFFSTPSPAFIICKFFFDCHSDRCEMTSHCGFDLYFPGD